MKKDIWYINKTTIFHLYLCFSWSQPSCFLFWCDFCLLFATSSVVCLVNFPGRLSFSFEWRFWPDDLKGLLARNGVWGAVRWAPISFLISLSFSCCDFGRLCVEFASLYDDFVEFDPKVEMKSLYADSLEVCLDFHWSGRFAYLLK